MGGRQLTDADKREQILLHYWLGRSMTETRAIMLGDGIAITRDEYLRILRDWVRLVDKNKRRGKRAA